MENNHQIIIVGAGPAGLQLAYFLEKQGYDYLILEKADKAGAFFERYPRHRTLISINKVYTGIDDEETNMRFDWNSLTSEEFKPLFKEYTREYFPDADKLVTYLNDYAQIHNVKVKYNTEVSMIDKDEKGQFTINTSTGETYTTEYLVMAAGLYLPYMPQINGMEHVIPYTECSVDPDDYINQRVLVLGKGNSAFETADALISTASKIHVLSPNPVKMAWKTHFVGHLRAINNNFLDTYQLKSQNALIDGEIEKITKQEDGSFKVTVAYAHANGEVEDLIYDKIIACTGFRFDNSVFAEGVMPELTINERFPNQKSSWESTNVDNLYFAGAITQMRDFKKHTSGFIHGFRYNCQCLFEILAGKINGKEWNNVKVEPTVEAITSHVIKSVNRTSSLWQQFGFIGDALVIDHNNKEARYYSNIPVDFAKDTYFMKEEEYFLITLEYGHEIFEKSPDPFKIERVHRNDVANADQSAFLHPIVRQYRGGELVSTHHIIEDFENLWSEEEVHVQPLFKYFQQQLKSAEVMS